MLLSFSFVACLPVGSVLRIDRHDGESQVLSTVAGEGNSGAPLIDKGEARKIGYSDESDNEWDSRMQNLKND